MTTAVRRQLQRIRQLLKDSKYRDAIEVVDSLDIVEPIASAELCILRTEAMLALGNFDSSYLEEALAILGPTGELTLFAYGKYLRARQLAVESDLLAAHECLLESMVSYKRADDLRGMGRTTNLMSILAYQRGDFNNFFRYAERSFGHYCEIGNLPKSGMVLSNMSSAYVRLGKFSEAKTTLTSISSEYFSEFTEDLKYNFYHISALLYAQLGETAKARQKLQEATSLRRDLRRELFRQYEIVSYVNILDGKYDEAEDALKQGLEISLEIAPESSLISQIKRLFGDLYVATRQWNKARKFTEEALAVAEKIGERVEIAACHRIYAQLETEHNNNEKAQDYYTQAIDLFALIGSNYELAVTRYLAGSSGLYHDGERQALLWLARRYFEQEKVTPFIEKTEQALAAPKSPRGPRVDRDGAPIIIAKSKIMTDIVALAENVAPSHMSILLTGETGTGKDLLAKYIHHHSGCSGEFVAVNAAAIPTPMIEAELFGHKKGSFTGSDNDRVGLMEKANEGTFYLNEIGDAPLEFQAKLLEVLETREIRRLGENEVRRASFRLIAATNHDPKQDINDGKFRLDLFHRLNEIPIELPPLSQRREDYTSLVEHFLSANGCALNGDSDQLERLGILLSILELPGNVRELKNFVENLQHQAEGKVVGMIDHVLNSGSLSEREWLHRALERTQWNRREAGRILGMSESTVRRRVQAYRLFDLS